MNRAHLRRLRLMKIRRLRQQRLLASKTTPPTTTMTTTTSLPTTTENTTPWYDPWTLGEISESTTQPEEIELTDALDYNYNYNIDDY